MRYYLVAGEASGDLHGANLMKALKIQDPDAAFRYFGGDKMKAEGGVLVKHYADMAYMGFLEVALHLRTILKNMKTCKADISQYQPDALILIDFPGFNLKIAEFAKAAGIRVFYYISPKVWAWNQKRVLKIKQVVDRLFCILPFEVDFYKSWGMDIDYVGNPLLDEISQFKAESSFAELAGLDHRPVVALLPGSRQQEIERLLPVMLTMVNQLPDYQFVIAGATDFNAAYYERFIGPRKVTLVFGRTYDLLHVSTAALVASGTATLETALFRVPQVVMYKGSPLTIAIARMVIKIGFISLVNLVMDRKVVEELIQEDCNPDRVYKTLQPLLTGEQREIMLRDYQELSIRMGEPGASLRTAQLMVEDLLK